MKHFKRGDWGLSDFWSKKMSYWCCVDGRGCAEISLKHLYGDVRLYCTLLWYSKDQTATFIKVINCEFTEKNCVFVFAQLIHT